VSELKQKLEAACQATSQACSLVSSRRRRSRRRRRLQGTGSAELSRPLSSGSLAAEIPELQSTGVAVTSTAFAGVDVLLMVAKQGGAEEAEALLRDSLSADQVQTLPTHP